tara:strand:+ start:7376 stop:8236 length:861 start_codon:yes stop_codon:yes gene_type:complete
MTKRKALGSGLDALLSSTGSVQQNRTNTAQGSPLDIQVHKIERNRHQPRKIFREDEIKQLAESINENGQIAPIVVREVGDKYEIVVGERRWRATQLLKKDTISGIIIEADDKTSAVLSIVENVQREDLNSMEEAESLQRLLDEFNMSHEDISKYICKSRAHVTNLIRLNDLCDYVKNQLRLDKISMGHARAVLTLSPHEQTRIIKLSVTRGLSVRAIEKMISTKSKKVKLTTKDQDTILLERQLTDLLGAKLSITQGKKGGVINIKYSSVPELQGIIDKIRNINTN